MTDNKYKGKILNFHTLLETHQIEIPIIQRDYAQGREDKQEIRNNFLFALFESINDEKPIKLDFIYGSNIEDSFQPLDGQQRLTTLFLLHWYASNKDNINNNSRDLLKKFSYETRITSRNFCEELVFNLIEINNQEEKISDKVIDSSWFFLSWKDDPTIDAMLRTIDDIHKLFYEIDDLWSKLISEKSIISFYFVELEHIGLTDDLYIKMNARGKLLTSFENFKAGFQKHIKEQKYEINVSFEDSFACKIDTIWTDFFWTNFRKKNSIDNALIRLIATIAMIRQSVERNDRIGDRLLTIKRLQDDSNNVKASMFNKNDFEYLFECFELYNNKQDQVSSINLDFPLWHNKPKENLLNEIVFESERASYPQKALFFAQTEYLRKADEISTEHFKNWMRVIKNIISRGDVERNGSRPGYVRSQQTFDGVINLIAELSEGCLDIYTFLSNVNVLKSTFAKDQIEEEKLKAKLILGNINRKKVIFEIEDNDLLRGRIEFVLYCMDFDGDVENFDDDLFVQIQVVLSKYFKKESEVSNDLRRALLTIENNDSYTYYHYWWSFWSVVLSNKRCLIDKFREIEYYIYSDHRIYFKKLILKLIETDLAGIISSFVPPSNFPNWQNRLIKEPDLLDNKSKSNYIAIVEDNSCCYLLKSMRPRDSKGCEEVK
jgi:hypothetical protein